MVSQLPDIMLRRTRSDDDEDVIELEPKPIPTPWDTIDPHIEFASAEPSVEAEAETETDLDFDFEMEADDLFANELPKKVARGGGAFTIPMICLGIGLIAACLLIPSADENRKLAYERERLKADLEQLQLQVSTNDAFLKRVANDPTLAERLARRQMKMVPQGTEVMDLKGINASRDMSPFLLVTIPPPAPLAPYKPVGGFLANACRHPKTQLYIIGASLLMIASGLVLSGSGSRTEPATPDAATTDTTSA